MEKSEAKKQVKFTYEEKGKNIVSKQIMDAYNSGVIDRENGRFIGDENEKSMK